MRADGGAGVVASLQTFGSFADFHPHVHVIATEGVTTPDGSFHPVTWPRKRQLEERFRRRFLTLWITRRIEDPDTALASYEGPRPDHIVADLKEVEALLGYESGR